MDRASLDVFREELVDKLAEFYDEQDVSGGDVEASDFFGTSAAELLVTNLHNIESPSDIRYHIGGECFDGQLQWLMKPSRASRSIRKPTQQLGAQSNRLQRKRDVSPPLLLNQLRLNASHNPLPSEPTPILAHPTLRCQKRLRLKGLEI
ncbi:hypothetical protein Pst134EA_031335 [Puccinia striiformis f. sp. tritici]|uniref:uncharacterized protein n=1 Tax=Puccinia striiformis f. sp. tritici TaxID=168172 RepID=UPI0020077AEA|nr:uncharacterized protein Pst134EA_031335 [Puccinia striiformis f. sp. tritici]KAH9445352.1 hypothetical protein Pst134EA_031335 [Puccinia striiformis f. sp. tritici]